MLDKILSRDELFAAGDEEKIWPKYCGFLSLSLDDFMIIQRSLLRDQISLLVDSPIGQKIMKKHKPRSIDEFRRIVPLSTYANYEPYLKYKNESILPVKPVIWAHTSGRTGFKKWAPYNLNQVARLADDIVAAFILASARRKGEVRLREGARVVLNLPPEPYLTGIMAAAAAQRISFRAIPPLEQAGQMDFYERIRKGFVMALDIGADFAASMAAVMAKIGDDFAAMGKNHDIPVSPLHPASAMRILIAITRARLAGRPLLPRDIWKLTGLVCGGTDTSIYREKIRYYWGIDPLDAYAATETGFIAMQAWDKTSMTFIPYSNFYEFIPEKEYLKSWADSKYQPGTVLLDEVEEGNTYELVVTNFYGGPFLRYRLKDLITITALKNKDTGINLPQMVFRSRTDDIIDIAGFTRLDEKTVWQAIRNTGIPNEDWVARKESLGQKPILHIYLELRQNGLREQEVGDLIDRQLANLDKNYSDLKLMTGNEPLVVTLFKSGTFKKYMENKQAAGFDLAHIKPAHMNVNNSIINELVDLSETPGAGVSPAPNQGDGSQE